MTDGFFKMIALESYVLRKRKEKSQPPHFMREEMETQTGWQFPQSGVMHFCHELHARNH